MLNLAALAAVLRFGSLSGGAARWIGIGAFRFQPSEFAKIALIITLAAALTGRRGGGVTARGVALSLVAHRGARGAGAQAARPGHRAGAGGDLVGRAASWPGPASGTSRRSWRAWRVLGVVAWHTPLLKPYQKARLTVFLDPSADPLGDGYHINQSRIAVGSGQWLGKGLLKGTQSQLHFIPAQHTDFIFTVVGEELGFAGAAALLALYGLLLWRGIDAAERAKDALGRVLAGGVVAMLGFPGVRQHRHDHRHHAHHRPPAAVPQLRGQQPGVGDDRRGAAAQRVHEEAEDPAVGRGPLPVGRPGACPERSRRVAAQGAAQGPLQ